MRHSEYNPSKTEKLEIRSNLIDLGRDRHHATLRAALADAKQGKQLVLSPDAREGSLKVHQDMELFAGRWRKMNSLYTRLPLTAACGSSGESSVHQRHQSDNRRWPGSSMSRRSPCMPTAKVKFCCLTCLLVYTSTFPTGKVELCP